MKRVTIFLVAVMALAAVPGAASAAVSPADYKNAAKFCKALRADMGAEPFKQAYGTNKNKRNAFGKCVSKQAHAIDRLHAQAVKECKAAATQSVSPQDTPGKGDDKRALRECVKQKLRELKAEHRKAIVNAAKQCKTERTADPVAFRDKYGTNETKSNAFGKCVSTTVRLTEESQPQS
jgi:hypothetical protein